MGLYTAAFAATLAVLAIVVDGRVGPACKESWMDPGCCHGAYSFGHVAGLAIGCDAAAVCLC